ncbi:hypothetical protein SISNIDRAFT_449868 [Sistotremastrum niveocremeum HHB9708]|uniref:Uncharacterized protein n=2 Tax=Sistotremastraceae TaxID=3402574 RepID=A0A164YQ38_9AGAM|nr:hypothetical protein SISNIDRAFT_449868 [Sistotremastrum niveocremeum HHB9708]KZT41628.1 hypothetical protein SISSUDRAFT_1042739 [Sistotremastrum suecicum HHB10207 ss-3]
MDGDCVSSNTVYKDSVTDPSDALASHPIGDHSAGAMDEGSEQNWTKQASLPSLCIANLSSLGEKTISQYKDIDSILLNYSGLDIPSDSSVRLEHKAEDKKCSEDQPGSPSEHISSTTSSGRADGVDLVNDSEIFMLSHSTSSSSNSETTLATAPYSIDDSHLEEGSSVLKLRGVPAPQVINIPQDYSAPSRTCDRNICLPEVPDAFYTGWGTIGSILQMDCTILIMISHLREMQLL